MSLHKLRSDLEKINQDLFKIIIRRREIVENIQSLKSKEGEFPFYDEKREKELFSSMKSDLEKLTPKELLAFSLLIESHAQIGDEDNYPSWFKGDITKSTNPNLLF